MNIQIFKFSAKYLKIILCNFKFNNLSLIISDTIKVFNIRILTTL